MKREWMVGLALTTIVTVSSQLVWAISSTVPPVAPYTSTKEKLEKITPADALKKLIDGNKRFATNNSKQRDLLAQTKHTSKGQFAFAVILSCMDSRGSPELIFDQGIGDIYSVRVAGNVIDSDQLGGLEFATKAMGSKLLVVMGHTRCGAVKGACQNVQLGNLTQLLDKIQPAVQAIKQQANGKINCDDYHTVDEIAKQNVLDMIKNIKAESPIVSTLAQNKQIMIVGAMHDLQTGTVMFFDENGNEIK